MSTTSITKSLPVSESHFTQDFDPTLPLGTLPPIVTCPSRSNSLRISRSTTSLTAQTRGSSSSNSPSTASQTSHDQQDPDDSGSDYYTSNSDSDSHSSQSQISPKRREKKLRLKIERDRFKPSYYYGERELEQEAIQKGVKPPKRKRKGCRGVPVFEPSLEQFQDFYSYINQIDRWGMRSGIVKIVPPKEWSDQLPHLGRESLRCDNEGQMLRNAKIKSPISQVIQGSRGLFRVMNVTKRRSYNALEWYDLANSNEHRPPDFSNKTHGQSSTEPSHLDTFSNNRTTRSSRRSTSNIAPISQKARTSRQRRVSKVQSAADNSTTVLSSSVNTDLPEHVTCSHSNLPAQIQCSPNSKSDSLSFPAPAPPPCAESTQHSCVLPHSATTLNGEISSEMQTDSKKDHSSPQEPVKACPSTPEARIIDLSTGKSEDVLIPSQATPPPEFTTLDHDRPEERGKKKHTKAPAGAPTPEEWATFVERYEQLPYGASKSDYTFQVCREIEQEYWRTIGNGGEPVYGADTMGSLFDDRTKHWNVANLDNLLNRLKLKKKIPGVNTPYLYFGSWRATFAWHVEDADLYSINYIHFGAPKFWYSIPQEHNRRFENFMGSSFAKERRTCSQFLRHKAFLASPAVLHSVGVQLNKVVHLPGEIIITYPYGYHSGFNLGYNCAESVNFANESWIEKGRKAQFCKCIDDAVTINVEAWLQEHEELCRKEEASRRRAAEKLKRQQQLEHRKRLKAEPPGNEAVYPKKKKKLGNSNSSHDHPEKHQDDLMKPSLTDPSLLDNQSSQTSAPAPTPKPIKQPRSKKIFSADGQTSAKTKMNKSDKALKRQSIAADSDIPVASTAHRISGKKSKILSGLQEKTFFPCALCPDPSEEGLLRIAEETSSIHNNPVQPGTCQESSRLVLDDDPLSNQTTCQSDLTRELRLETRCESDLSPELELVQSQMRSKSIKRAHKVCCMFTPSTWFEKLPSGEEVVKGFEAIEKARWGLKCQLCKEKMGTKVQCTKSEKCAKACHVTCGLRTGLFLLDARFTQGNMSYSLLDPSPEGPPPGLDVGQDPELVVLCKQHNPLYQRAEAERRAKELASKVAKFAPGENIKVKTLKGIFQVFFNSCDESRKTLYVTFEDGHSDILPYSKVYFGSADTNNSKKNHDSNFDKSDRAHLQVVMNGQNGSTCPIESAIPIPTRASASTDTSQSIESKIDPIMKMISNSSFMSTHSDQASSSPLAFNLNQEVGNNFFMQNDKHVGMNVTSNSDDRRLFLLADLSSVGHSNPPLSHPDHSHLYHNDISPSLSMSSTHNIFHHQNNTGYNHDNLNRASNSFDGALPHQSLTTLSAIQRGLIDSRLL